MKGDRSLESHLRESLGILSCSSNTIRCLKTKQFPAKLLYFSASKARELLVIKLINFFNAKENARKSNFFPANLENFSNKICKDPLTGIVGYGLVVGSAYLQAFLRKQKAAFERMSIELEFTDQKSNTLEGGETYFRDKPPSKELEFSPSDKKEDKTKNATNADEKEKTTETNQGCSEAPAWPKLEIFSRKRSEKKEEIANHIPPEKAMPSEKSKRLRHDSEIFCIISQKARPDSVAKFPRLKDGSISSISVNRGESVCSLEDFTEQLFARKLERSFEQPSPKPSTKGTAKNAKSSPAISFLETLEDFLSKVPTRRILVALLASSGVVSAHVVSSSRMRLKFLRKAKSLSLKLSLCVAVASLVSLLVKYIAEVKQKNRESFKKKKNSSE